MNQEPLEDHDFTKSEEKETKDKESNSHEGENRLFRKFNYPPAKTGLYPSPLNHLVQQICDHLGVPLLNRAISHAPKFLSILSIFSRLALLKFVGNPLIVVTVFPPRPVFLS